MELKVSEFAKLNGITSQLRQFFTDIREKKQGFRKNFKQKARSLFRLLCRSQPPHGRRVADKRMVLLSAFVGLRLISRWQLP
jgi:hypothetical protein